MNTQYPTVWMRGNGKRVHITQILTPPHGNTLRACEGMDWGVHDEGSIYKQEKLLATPPHATWPF